MDKLTIEILGTEQEIIEGILNMASSGCDTFITLGFLSLAKGWHVNKIFYYMELIKEVEDSFFD